MNNKNYYNESYGSTPKRRHSLVRLLLRLLFAAVSIFAAISLLLALISPFIHPEGWWVFPVVGLLAPAIYVANFVIALVWILRWRWKFALPIIILLLLGSGYVTRFAKIDLNNHYGTPSYRGAVKVMTYNVRSHFRDDKEWSTDNLTQYMDSISADIICVQENRADRFKDSFVGTKLAKYNVANNSSLSIYSRYPIVAQSDNKIPTEGYEGISRSMWVDLKIDKDTLRVFNNHLNSTMIKEQDDKYLTSREFIADSLREDKLTDIISRFKSSSSHRASHADSLQIVIAESPYRVIVCGDFNDTPLSYTYKAIARDLNDAFVECGTGLPHTYRGFMNTLRIDYILASEGVEFESYTIDNEMTSSDHLPVITHFKLTK